MSSYDSTITISDSEWNQIKKKVSDTEVYIVKRREEADQLRLQIQKRERELKEMKERGEKVVNDAVILIEGAFNATVQSLKESSRESLNASVKSFYDEIALLKNDIEHTARGTTAASIHINEISKVYSEVLEHRIKQETDSSKSAGIYMENVLSLNEQINTLNPTVFEPVVFSELNGIILDTKNNIKSGRYEAALTTSRVAILKASGLLTRLIATNDLFNREILETTELANALKAEFDRLDPKMNGAILFDIEGEEYEYQYDIDHWSEGRFSRLRDDFESARVILNKAQHKPVPVEEIKTLKRKIVDLEKKLKHCDIVARQELIGSRMARETAARLCDSLLANNWRLGEYGYDRDDDRNPYTMILQDAAGNDISVVISPGTSADKSNVHIEAFNEEPEHAEIVKRDVIQVLLPDSGICVERTQCHNDCENNVDSKTFIQNTLSKTGLLNNQRRKMSFGD